MSDAQIFRGLFLAWQRVTAAYDTEMPPDGSERERTLYRQMRDLETFAAQRPAQSVEAFAFKVLMADDQGGMNDTPAQRALVAEARAIADRMAEADAPVIPRLYREREALRAAYLVYPVADGLDHDAECDALFLDRADELADAIEALPAVTAADFAAKAAVATVDGGLCIDWDTGALWKEARALLAV